MAYLLDPDQGRRRRALLRDKSYHTFNETRNLLAAVARDARNRLRAIRAQARRVAGTFSPAPVLDDVLAERVRSRIGRAVSYAKAIDVVARQGVVTLRGSVHADEAGRALKAAGAVRGVQEVVDQLEWHEPERDDRGPQPEHRKRIRTVAPAARPFAGRAAAGIAGFLLVRYGVGRSGIARALSRTAGVALLARAWMKSDLRRRRGIAIARRLHVRAPAERVYAFWDQLENFPTFMRNVRSVSRRGPRLWHWEVTGPQSASVEWDAEVTERIPERLLAWESLAGSPVRHAGRVRFETGDEGTWLDVRLSYRPMGAVSDHVVASLFGINPRAEIDEDLLRMKSRLETVAAGDTAESRIGARTPHPI
ncbi:MAG: SRPBCC family protein [Acidiferrobacteraceae bacterium]